MTGPSAKPYLQNWLNKTKLTTTASLLMLGKLERGMGFISSLLSPKIPAKGWFEILHILKTDNNHLQNQLHSGKNKTGNNDQSKAQLGAVGLPGHRRLQATHAGVLSSHTPRVQYTRVCHQK